MRFPCTMLLSGERLFDCSSMLKCIQQVRLGINSPVDDIVQKNFVQVSWLWFARGSLHILTLISPASLSLPRWYVWLILVHIGCVTLCFATASVLVHLKGSKPRASAAISMCSALALDSILAASIRLGGRELTELYGSAGFFLEVGLYESQASVLSAFLCFRFVDCIPPVLGSMVAQLVTMPMVTDGHYNGLVGVPWTLVVAYLLQEARHQACKVEGQLACEKEAAEALISRLCDSGGIWLAHDGDTVVSSDARFDEITGIPMAGTRLSQHLASVDDARKLEHALKMRPLQCLAEPVVLISVMLERSQMPPTKVDLFIADRRRSVSLANEAGLDSSQPGYLLGLRLADPFAVEPLPQQAHHGLELIQKVVPLRSASSADFNVDVEASYCNIEVEASWAVETLPSTELPSLEVTTCTREFVDSVMTKLLPHELAYTTIRRMIDLARDYAKGGVLIVVAAEDALDEVFNEDLGEDGGEVKPVLSSSDGGYMTGRLRGIPVSHPDFARAFQEFTEHSATDRWPVNHPHSAARGQPKDGAFLISFSGYRKKCAAKILGLRPPMAWRGVGTKHETALACAWAVRDSVVLVRSDSGTLHVLWRRGSRVHVHKIIAREVAGPFLGDESIMGSSSSFGDIGNDDAGDFSSC
mmetsp:Transcript_33608/g.85110  ORF Transcript_33608/g.85110 Transcript_33608/m.85110 type:complete len:643 (+) Transcript_33608:56-1984(+)